MRSAGCQTGRVSGPRLLARQFPAQPEIPQGEFTSPEDLKEKGSRAAKAAWEVPAGNQSNRSVRHAGRLTFALCDAVGRLPNRPRKRPAPFGASISGAAGNSAGRIHFARGFERKGFPRGESSVGGACPKPVKSTCSPCWAAEP